MFIGYNNARRSGLPPKDFLRGSPCSKPLKNPRLAAEQEKLHSPSAEALGTL
jgi:hypothetical protein